jgi:hypothetical protein
MSEQNASSVILTYAESRRIMKASLRMTANGLRLIDCYFVARSVGFKR